MQSSDVESPFSMNQSIQSDTFPSSERSIFGLSGLFLGLAVPGLVFGKAAMAPFLLIALVAAAIGFVRFGGARQVFRFSRSGLALSVWGFLAVLAISSLLSIDVAVSAEILARLGGSLLFGWACLRVLSWSETALGLACKGVVAGGMGAFALVAFGLYFQPVVVEIRHWLGLTDPFYAPSVFKLFASATICLLPILLWAAWRLGGRWRLAIPFAPFLAGVVVYGDGAETSFSALFGMIGGGVLLLLVLIGLHAPTVLRRGLVLVVLAAGVALAAYVLPKLPSPPVVADQVAQLPIPDWHRQVIWGFALEVILDNPVLGVGPNTINLVPGSNDIIPGMNQEYIPGHPHNSVLEIAAEAGLVGLAALATVIVLLLRKFFQNAVRARAGSVGRDAFGAALAGIFLTGSFWTSSLSNFSIWSAWWVATFILLIALPLAACARAEKDGAGG